MNEMIMGIEKIMRLEKKCSVMDSVIRESICPLTAVDSYAIVTEILYRINNIISHLMFCGCNKFEKQRTIQRVVIF